MAKSREQKEQLLSKYEEILDTVDGYIAVNPAQVDSITVTTLKRKLKEINSKLVVVKNTVFKIALQNKQDKLPVQAIDFTGSTAIITYSADPTTPAKLIKEVQKESESFEARYGVIDGSFVDNKNVMALADIPDRETLLAQLVGTMNAPLSGFMNACTGNVRGFVRVLSEKSKI